MVVLDANPDRGRERFELRIDAQSGHHDHTPPLSDYVQSHCRDKREGADYGEWCARRCKEEHCSTSSSETVCNDAHH